MTAPDAREWYALDPEKPAVEEMDKAIKQFSAIHPNITFGRFTILGAESSAPWLCVDGWLITPDDQGQPPTEADIPMGFV
jgi:hypothetical protein